MYPWRRVLLAVLISALAHSPGRSETLILPPDADTALFEFGPGLNFGAQDDLPSGTLGQAAGNTRSRLLLRFDLAGALPPGARLRGASLELTVTRVPAGGGLDSVFALHHVLQAWHEGTKQGTPPGGAPAGPGETTWTHRAIPDTAWGAPGGLAGVDYEEAASSSERVRGVGTYVFEFGESQLAQMQAWLREPESNHGWMLISRSEDVPTTARRFGSREVRQESSRPRLLVEFETTPAVPPPVIQGLVLGEGEVRVTLAAEAAVPYRLEFSGELGGGTWSSASAPQSTNQAGLMTLVDPSPAAGARWYRVAAGP